MVVAVVEYNVVDTAEFYTREAKKEIIKLVFDGKFDWLKLEPLLTSYTKGQFQDQLFNNELVHLPELPKTNSVLEELWHKERALNQSFHTGLNHQQGIKNITEENFQIDFNDVRFSLGFITFKKYFKRIDQTLECKIFNDHILPEYDNIKNWFSLKLKSKKISVKVTVVLVVNQAPEVSATSPQIDLINPDLIDSIKYQRTYALIKEPKQSDVDKSLFTASDIFSQIDSNDIEGNVFNQSEEDILNFFMEKGKVRNTKELAYLAGKKQSENFPLRYTLHPNFGFLFTIEGERNNHFVWELLNSNATYIWSVSKRGNDGGFQVKRIEELISLVRSMGREAYKRNYKTNPLYNELVFYVIRHLDIGSGIQGAFPRWKAKLNEQLI